MSRAILRETTSLRRAGGQCCMEATGLYLRTSPFERSTTRCFATSGTMTMKLCCCRAVWTGRKRKCIEKRQFQLLLGRIISDCSEKTWCWHISPATLFYTVRCPDSSKICWSSPRELLDSYCADSVPLCTAALGWSGAISGEIRNEFSRRRLIDPAYTSHELQAARLKYMRQGI